MMTRALPLTLLILGLTTSFAAAKSADGPLLEMLGMADEYISRFDYIGGKPRPGLVESFYPHEKKLADHYQKLIAELERARRRRFKVQRRVGRFGHISFHSPVLARLINARYVKRGNLATLDPLWLMRQRSAHKWRYLLGAHRRYGKQNTIRMANAGSKIETLGRLVKQLGASKAAAVAERTIPTGTWLFFDPSPKMIRALGVTKLSPPPRSGESRVSWL